MARILIADDAAVVRLLLGQILEGGGHDVVAEATTGDETIRLYSESRPDVAVIDVNMPGRTGLEAARAIRQLDPSARLVLMSVLTNTTRLAEARALDASFLEKPFEAADLLAAIARLA
jgi:two-component system chemotaxis response regulator CheY